MWVRHRGVKQLGVLGQRDAGEMRFPDWQPHVRGPPTAGPWVLLEAPQRPSAATTAPLMCLSVMEDVGCWG